MPWDEFDLAASAERPPLDDALVRRDRGVFVAQARRVVLSDVELALMEGGRVRVTGRGPAVIFRRRCPLWAVGDVWLDVPLRQAVAVPVDVGKTSAMVM